MVPEGSIHHFGMAWLSKAAHIMVDRKQKEGIRPTFHTPCYELEHTT